MSAYSSVKIFSLSGRQGTLPPRSVLPETDSQVIRCPLSQEVRQVKMEIQLFTCKKWNMTETKSQVTSSRSKAQIDNVRGNTNFVVVQKLSCVRLFATLWTAAHQAFLSFNISWNVLKLMSMESVMPSSHLVLCRPLLQPSVFPSIRVFSKESALHIRGPKYQSFSFSISPFSEYPGLIFEYGIQLILIKTLQILFGEGTIKIYPSTKVGGVSPLKCYYFSFSFHTLAH